MDLKALLRSLSVLVLCRSLRPNLALSESGLAREMVDLAFYRVGLRSHRWAKGVSGGWRTWGVCYAFQTHG